MNGTLSSNTQAAWISAWYDDKLSNEEEVQLFQYLIDDGLAWAAGVAIRTRAEQLIRQGQCAEALQCALPVNACALPPAPAPTVPEEEALCFWCQSYVPIEQASLVGVDPATGLDMYWCGCVQE